VEATWVVDGVDLGSWRRGLPVHHTDIVHLGRGGGEEEDVVKEAAEGYARATSSSSSSSSRIVVRMVDYYLVFDVGVVC
jgi:hypothetical protein